jgi:hypothetical protein
MKAYKIAGAIFLIFIKFDPLFAQTKMSKKQVLKILNEEKLSVSGKDSLLSNFIFSDSLLKRKFSFEIKKLKDPVIDTFGIFQISFPGFAGGTNDSCNSGIYPSNNYLFWISGNKTFYKILTGRCEFENRESSRLTFFNYYLKNSKEINSENILPVIFGREISLKNEVVFSVSDTDHEPKYKIYIQTGNNFRFFRFSESDLTNKKSLFYYDNVNSKLYKFVFLFKKEFNIITELTRISQAGQHFH